MAKSQRENFLFKQPLIQDESQPSLENNINIKAAVHQSMRDGWRFQTEFSKKLVDLNKT